MKRKQSNFFEKYAKIYDRFMEVTKLANEDSLLKYLGDITGKEIADIGGGTGTLATLLAKNGANVTIIDPSLCMTEKARNKNDKINVVNACAECLPIPTSRFDIVCMKDSLHHIAGQEKAIRELTRILKPKGVVLIMEFDPKKLKSKLIYYFERFCGEKVNFINPLELMDIFKTLSISGKIIYISKFEYIFLGCKDEKTEVIS